MERISGLRKLGHHKQSWSLEKCKFTRIAAALFNFFLPKGKKPVRSPHLHVRYHAAGLQCYCSCCGPGLRHSPLTTAPGWINGSCFCPSMPVPPDPTQTSNWKNVSLSVPLPSWPGAWHALFHTVPPLSCLARVQRDCPELMREHPHTTLPVCTHSRMCCWGSTVLADPEPVGP